MLLLGIMYGRHRWNVNKRTEDAFRAEEAINKPIRDAKAAEEAAALNRKEMLELAREVGVKVPEGF